MTAKVIRKNIIPEGDTKKRKTKMKEEGDGAADESDSLLYNKPSYCAKKKGSPSSLRRKKKRRVEREFPGNKETDLDDEDEVSGDYEEEEEEDEEALHQFPRQPGNPMSDRDHDAMERCHICLSGNNFSDTNGETDDLVFCDGCDLVVHQTCHGNIEEIPKGSWFCDVCTVCLKAGVRKSQLKQIPKPECQICGQRYSKVGLLKKTVGNKWAHVSCASWVPECKFLDERKREGITGIQRISNERLKLRWFS